MFVCTGDMCTITIQKLSLSNLECQEAEMFERYCMIAICLILGVKSTCIPYCDEILKYVRGFIIHILFIYILSHTGAPI